LLVAPIVREGGEVEVALPPGAWFDLNTRRRFAGRQVLRYRAKLDQFPVFGREGYALPLGRAVQHTGEIDSTSPLESLWVFGAPQAPLSAFSQASIAPDESGTLTVNAEPALAVEIFGDVDAVRVARR